MQFGVITPCETTPNISYCVDVQTGSRPEDMKSWCPKNAGSKMDGKPVAFEEGLANSMNNITVSVIDRKSTRLNSSHVRISYAVFCLKKKKNKTLETSIQ